MQAHPLAQQCWDNLQDAQSCLPVAEGHSLCSWMRHMWTFMCVCVCWLLVSDFLQLIKLFVNSCICNLIFFHLLHYCLLVFSSFFFSHKDIFSRFVRAAHPPLPLISLGVTLRFGLSWQRRTQARLYSICEVSVVASILHICCWDREEPCTTIPHPHLVTNMKAWMSSQKYNRDMNLFL